MTDQTARKKQEKKKNKNQTDSMKNLILKKREMRVMSPSNGGFKGILMSRMQGVCSQSPN
jgi:hypothetical protein